MFKKKRQHIIESSSLTTKDKHLNNTNNLTTKKQQIVNRQDTQGQFIPSSSSSMKKKHILSKPKAGEKNVNHQQNHIKNITNESLQLNVSNFIKTSSSSLSTTNKYQASQIQSLNKSRIMPSNDQSSTQVVVQYTSFHKEIIDLSQLLELLTFMTSRIQQQYQDLQSATMKPEQQAVHLRLFYSKYFRFVQLQSISHLCQRYSSTLQSCQLLLSKLKNRFGENVHFHKLTDKEEEKLYKVYIENQQKFLMFFKHFFSKPYTLCNRPQMRKILSVLWDWVRFSYSSMNGNGKNNQGKFNIEKSYEPLKLWIYGISLPSNPEIPSLHRAVYAVQKESKSKGSGSGTSMMLNKIINYSQPAGQNIYIGIDQVDSILRTPLQLAVQADANKSTQKLIKCGANCFESPWIESSTNSQGQFDDYQFILSKPTVTQNTTFSTTQYNFNINLPTYIKRQVSPFEYLLFNKKMKLLAQCFYHKQLAHIKKLKKLTQQIKQKLLDIPNCTFQIDWKTSRGLLNFKQLPKDIISVSKKDKMLRIDYHVDSLIQDDQQSGQKSKGKQKMGKLKKSFTILIKIVQKSIKKQTTTTTTKFKEEDTQEEQLQFFQIRHHEKKIINRLKQVDLRFIDKVYQDFVKFPFSRNFQVNSCKGTYTLTPTQFENKKISLKASIQMSSQYLSSSSSKNIGQQPCLRHFENYKQYMYQTQMFDYKALEKSELECILNQTALRKQNISTSQKYFIINENNKTSKSSASSAISSKRQKITVGLQAQLEPQILTFSHIEYFLSLVFAKDSVMIGRILKVSALFRQFGNPLAVPYSSMKQTPPVTARMLPFSTKIKISKEITLEIDIKNLNYFNVPDAVFTTEIKAKSQQMNYAEKRQKDVLASLNQTQNIQHDQNLFSINVSQFLGRTQKMLDIQDSQARERFQKLLQQECLKVDNQQQGGEGDILQQ